MGVLTIGVFSSLVGSMDLDFAVRLAQAAINKGHTVNFWLSSNATTIAKDKQKEFKDYNYLDKTLRALIEKGLAVVSCEACNQARGIHKEDMIAGINRASMDWYLAKAAQSDRVIHIGVE
ncbi:MAG: DsrE family protein [Nitrospirota bacterium]